MRFVTAGESHGPALTTIITDVPSGIKVSASDIDIQLCRRQQGYGRGGRMQIETDKVSISSGVRFGLTLGSPITLSLLNRDWENWKDKMAVEDDAVVVSKETCPRPGHADLVGAQKRGFDDCRNVLERASARETACRVAAGSIARSMLKELGVEIGSYVKRIGAVELESQGDSSFIEELDIETIEASPVRCPNEDTSNAMCDAIDAARDAKDSLGGEIVVFARGLVPGLGDYTEGGKRLTSLLGGALFSIPAIKSVEFGHGAALSSLPGSLAHDEIIYSKDTGFGRRSNNAGGLEGGMTTGSPLVATLSMKPIPTLMQPLQTVDLETLEPTSASKERSDVCAVPAVGVIAEAEVALVLASAYQQKFGSDSLFDIKAAQTIYMNRITR